MTGSALRSPVVNFPVYFGNGFTGRKMNGCGVFRNALKKDMDKQKKEYEGRKKAMASSPLFTRPIISIAIISIAVLLLLLPIGSWAHGSRGNAPAVLKYHNGPVLSGQLNLAILWYGRFGKQSKSILRAFINSLNKRSLADPGVNTWWKKVEKYQAAAHRNGISPPIRVRIVKQQTDPNYSDGKILTQDFFPGLVQKATGGVSSYIAVIFTARDVSVDATCMGRCSRHGTVGAGRQRTLYMIVGNPETECPGDCAWPFVKSDYGPQTAPLQSPNGNIGADSMVIGLASALVGTVTNPYNNGFFDGPEMDPVEAVTACPGMFGSGSFAGYAGKYHMAPGTGGCFNAHGSKGRKFLLPAIWDPTTRSCWTII